MKYKELTSIIIGLCIKVHQKLGPGLLESVYEAALCYELTKLEMPFSRQQAIPVKYDEVTLDVGFRADIIVDGKVILELKSIESIAPVHPKILLTYMKLTKIEVGLLINFNEVLLKDGITRLISDKE